MTTIKEAAMKHVDFKVSCIECGARLHYAQSIRCRKCFNLYFKDYSGFGKAFIGPKNHKWKEGKIDYSSLHSWVRRHKPKQKACSMCFEEKKLQASNISGEYKRDLDDYQWLCVRCHVYLDGTVNNLKPRNRKEVHNGRITNH